MGPISQCAVKRGGKVFCPEPSCSGGAPLSHTDIARRVDGDLRAGPVRAAVGDSRPHVSLLVTP